MRRTPRQGRLLRWIHGREGPAWGDAPGDYDPEAVARTVARLRPLFEGYFALDVEGMERIPDPPTMVVSNHSGGTLIPDVWGWLLSWYGHFGSHRPLHPMAHEIVLSTRTPGEWLGRRGVLRASPALARKVLGEWGRDLYVLPGGDVEVWRPYRERYAVRFAGRQGYARLALECGVPIVPVAHAGAHETLVVLHSGRTLARLLRLPRIARAEIWPIHLSLPWGLAIGPLPHLPTPAKLRYRVGAPIPPEGTPEVLDRRVRDAIQALMDELAADRAVLAERIVDRLRRWLPPY